MKNYKDIPEAIKDILTIEGYNTYFKIGQVYDQMLNNMIINSPAICYSQTDINLYNYSNGINHISNITYSIYLDCGNNDFNESMLKLINQINQNIFIKINDVLYHLVVTDTIIFDYKNKPIFQLILQITI
jgi:hypothetical protein